MHIKTLPALIAFGLASAALQAHAVDDRLYLAPTLNYTFSDSDRNADDGWGGGLALGKPISPAWNLELALSRSALDLNAGGDYDLWGLGVDGLYFFNRNAHFAPYGVVGLGALHTEIPGRRDTGVMANAGLGFMKQLSDNLALRADARYRWDDNSTDAFNKSHFGDWLVSVGLNIALGKKAQPAPQPAPEPMAQPAPVPMAQPAPEPVAQPQPAPEAAPAFKTRQGAELNGAQSGDVVVILEGVNFEFDSAKLRPNAIEILDEAVTVLNRRNDIKVDIVGHTCNIGTDEYNQGLSERRAQSVYDYLVSHGIVAERLTTRGMGETQPAHSNATRDGRAKNRRVEMQVK
ncbi:OmpA family protein [Thiobacillus sp.]